MMRDMMRRQMRQTRDLILSTVFSVRGERVLQHGHCFSISQQQDTKVLPVYVV